MLALEAVAQRLKTKRIQMQQNLAFGSTRQRRQVPSALVAVAGFRPHYVNEGCAKLYVSQTRNLT
jgi:4-hydroxy-L-threonine phosphate dehydrogenase PdxA